ncbi:MAG: hypothetical protein ACLQPD_15250 [Desulfomonilaceae bacterium]
MPKQKDERETTLAAVQPLSDIVVPAPDSGFLGRFLDETENMLRARAMRMSGLLRTLNESGQRTELLLRKAAERMEAAHYKLERDLQKAGLMRPLNGDEADEGQAE